MGFVPVFYQVLNIYLVVLDVSLRNLHFVLILPMGLLQTKNHPFTVSVKRWFCRSVVQPHYKKHSS